MTVLIFNNILWENKKFRKYSKKYCAQDFLEKNQNDLVMSSDLV